MLSTRALATALLVALTTTACSLVGGDDRAASTSTDEVVLVTHESFVLPKPLRRAFEEQSGRRLVIRAAGDAGTLTNKLVLTRGNPIGDVAFGVDNTFASRALGEGVFEPHEFDLPPGAEQFLLPGDKQRRLTPVDTGDVCVNVDDTWFAARDLEPPATLEDLADPAYRDLFVLPGATTSSPGMAFLLATIAEYDDAWPAYWERLLANGAKLTDGWSDAYQVDFTQGGARGDRPIVLSYDSSPAFTVRGGRTTTSALLDTCFAQVEYAGVLADAANPEGARELVEFLLTPEVQRALPEAMYVRPVSDEVELPREWARFAPPSTDPYEIDPQEITENRDIWLREWSELTSR